MLLGVCVYMHAFFWVMRRDFAALLHALLSEHFHSVCRLLDGRSCWVFGRKGGAWDFWGCTSDVFV